jgi:hypothetical protein
MSHPGVALTFAMIAGNHRRRSFMVLSRMWRLPPIKLLQRIRIPGRHLI